MVKVKLSRVLEEGFLVGVVVHVSPPDSEAFLEPERLRIILQAPSGVPASLKVEPARTTMDLEGLSAGGHSVVPRVSAPAGARVIDVDPPAIRVTLEGGQNPQEGG